MSVVDDEYCRVPADRNRPRSVHEKAVPEVGRLDACRIRQCLSASGGCVVAVSDDAEAEAFVGALIADGHELLATVEQEAVG